MPLSAPGVFTAGILAFVNSWDEFLLALSLNSSPTIRTLPVGITLYQGEFTFPWPVISAALVVGIVPVADPDHDLPGEGRVRSDDRRPQRDDADGRSRPPQRIEDLRSQRWYAANDMRGFAHRQRTQQMGLRREEFLGKPVIAIVNTWSEMSPCHAHLRDRAEAVKRGVWQAGGYPVELPALSVGEVMVKPSTMLYRNFLAMEVGGAAALASDRRRGAARRLRQVHARPADGRHQHGPAGDLLPGRPDVERPMARRDGRRRHAHQEILGRLARSAGSRDEDWVDLESHMTRIDRHLQHRWAPPRP